jgi:hypothetical protein
MVLQQLQLRFASVNPKADNKVFLLCFCCILSFVSLVKKHGWNWDAGVPEMITKMRLRDELDEPIDGIPPVPPSTLTKKRLIHFLFVL